MKKMKDYSEEFKKRIDAKVKRLRFLSSQKNVDKEDFVKVLQKINKEILNCKIIVGKKMIIYPIWIEAYYNDYNLFDDDSCHDKKGVKYKLRIHSEGEGGVDLYIGDEKKEYFLSILIKLSLIRSLNSKKYHPRSLVSQKQLPTKLCSNASTKELYFDETDLDLDAININLTKRVRITNNYKDFELAAYLSPKSYDYDDLRDNTITYCFKK